MENQALYKEGTDLIEFLRNLGKEEQKIAYAIMEGMRVQRELDSHDGKTLPPPATHASRPANAV